MAGSNFCDCTGDGYCRRYGRDMGGRMREICAGTNVDLGTAAAFREQWRREAGVLPQGSGGEPKKLLLRTGQAPGDAVAMTAAIYSLHRSHPGRYVTAVESYWPEVFQHNPDVVEHLMPTGVSPRAPDKYSDIEMHYPLVHLSNKVGRHFMDGWCSFLGQALNVNIPLLTNRPIILFKEEVPPQEDYWVICSGGKKDFTTKLWGHDRYQEVVRILKGNVSFIQVGGSRPPVPWHPSTMGAMEDSHSALEGTVANMVGMTSLRELFDLVRRSKGVLCGVSLLMHVAAALEKPAVVVAGGREPVQWNSYPLQTFVHTVGALPCHDTHGNTGVACWRYRTVPLGDGTVLDSNTCEFPEGETPRCMTLISPNYVSECILRYNNNI